MVSRRAFFRTMLAAGLAEAMVDPEILIWTPKSMITVPDIQQVGGWSGQPNIGMLVAQAWNDCINADPMDTAFSQKWLIEALRKFES